MADNLKIKQRICSWVEHDFIRNISWHALPLFLCITWALLFWILSQQEESENPTVVPPLHQRAAYGTKSVIPMIHAPPLTKERPSIPVAASTPSTAKVSQVFRDHAFQLNKGRAPSNVPRIYLNTIPKDWNCPTTESPRTKRALFIKILLPIILEVNEKILDTRNRLLSLRKIHKTSKSLSSSDRAWLQDLAKAYRVRKGHALIDTLLTKVDIIPPSLALAQAIIETGWGGSPAALQKNSLFGHMENPVSVRAYSSLYKSVHAYIHNLNKHPAYAKLREKRRKMRQGQHPLSSLDLAEELTRYCTVSGYIPQVQAAIKRYSLEILDQARLSPALS